MTIVIQCFVNITAPIDLRNIQWIKNTHVIIAIKDLANLFTVVSVKLTAHNPSECVHYSYIHHNKFSCFHINQTYDSSKYILE